MAKKAPPPPHTYSRNPNPQEKIRKNIGPAGKGTYIDNGRIRYNAFGETLECLICHAACGGFYRGDNNKSRYRYKYNNRRIDKGKNRGGTHIAEHEEPFLLNDKIMAELDSRMHIKNKLTIDAKHTFVPNPPLAPC